MYTKKLIFSLAMALCSGSLMAQSEYIAPEFNTESVSSNGTIDSTSENVEVLSAPTYPIGSPVQLWGKLKVGKNSKGIRCLCDRYGNPVQLRGMSSHGMQWAGVACLTRENMRTLRDDWNTNVFRIAVYVDEEGGYAYNPTHRTRYIDNLVKWCGENGMYLIIDWHTLTPGNPQSAVYRKRRDTGRDLAADFFTYCARRYQKQSHVIYEVCNEPNGVNYHNNQFGGSKWPSFYDPRVTWKDHIKPYCEEMLKIIRSYDKDVVVICGTPHWDQRPQDVVGNEPVDANGKKYENLMYTFHFYAASHNDGRHDETAVKFWDVNFMKAFKTGDGKTPCILKELPIFVTEWGTTDASGWSNFRPDLADMWLDIFNGNNDGKQVVSWCNWNFSAEGGACAALNWNTGYMQPFDEKILTESGRYIYKKLHEKFHTVETGLK
jgi:endoglucanase